MKMKKHLIVFLVAATVGTIAANTSISYAGNFIIPSFVKSLKADPILNSKTNEDEINNIIIEKAKAQHLSNEERDIAIKQFIGSRLTELDIDAQEKLKNNFKQTDEYKLLMEERKIHTDKMNKVEAEIQKHVSYQVLNNKEKNISFLLDNLDALNLDQDLIHYYISGYNHWVKDNKVKNKLDKYLDISGNNRSNQVYSSNLSYNILGFKIGPTIVKAETTYDRNAARNYAYSYVGTNLGVFDSTGYNTYTYPVYDSPSYPHNDCANFASQCLHAGGKAFVGTDYNSANSWFCRTNSEAILSAVAYTWRTTDGFKTYWKPRSTYSEVKQRNAYTSSDFKTNVWDKMYYGDVIQLADAYGAPWHTLNVTAYSTPSYSYDIGYTAHSVNRKDQSLFGYTQQTDDLLLLYHVQ